MNISLIFKLRHIRTCHLNQKVHCEHCSKSYTDLMSLKAHKIKEHDMNAPYHCESCGQPFLFLSQYKIHSTRSVCKRRRRKQDEKVSEVICPICNRSFSSETNLKRHNNTIHLKIKKFECETCSKSFSQKVSILLRIFPPKTSNCSRGFQKHSGSYDLIEHIFVIGFLKSPEQRTKRILEI